MSNSKETVCLVCAQNRCFWQKSFNRKEYVITMLWSLQVEQFNVTWQCWYSSRSFTFANTWGNTVTRNPGPTRKFLFACFNLKRKWNTITLDLLENLDKLVNNPIESGTRKATISLLRKCFRFCHRTAK